MVPGKRLKTVLGLLSGPDQSARETALITLNFLLTSFGQNNVELGLLLFSKQPQLQQRPAAQAAGTRNIFLP